MSDMWWPKDQKYSCILIYDTDILLWIIQVCNILNFYVKKKWLGDIILACPIKKKPVLKKKEKRCAEMEAQPDYRGWS